ncbi:MAG: 4Fe-4S binding protein [Nitrospirae bacterium]|nr:MAG: 4Fe-4S binding protein [Nitrospirota bacterium]
MAGQNRSYIRYLRYALQAYIVLFLGYAGIEFHRFVGHFIAGSGAAVNTAQVLGSRPASIEGFLPIGALMSFKLWLLTGIFDSIHPAGLVIFLAALLMALLLKKGFCGWICPVGAISDVVGKLGKRLFGKNFRMNRYADYGLRSLKYVLMLFFLYVILYSMSPMVILGFLGGDYYKIADVKMLYFFTQMTTTTLVSLVVLFLLSLVYRNFWCRYLCPYGGLLGLLSLLSPLKITRNEEACIHCRRCSGHCPSLLPVDSTVRITSPECTGCLTCVSHCPAAGALDVSFAPKRPVQPLVFALLIVVFFFGSIGLAKLAGRWESSVTYQDYQRVIPAASELAHP